MKRLCKVETAKFFVLYWCGKESLTWIFGVGTIYSNLMKSAFYSPVFLRGRQFEIQKKIRGWRNY